MYKALIDLSRETRADLPAAMEEATARIKAGNHEGAGVLLQGWAEFDLQVQTQSASSDYQHRVAA